MWDIRFKVENKTLLYFTNFLLADYIPHILQPMQRCSKTKGARLTVARLSEGRMNDDEIRCENVRLDRPACVCVCVYVRNGGTHTHTDPTRARGTGERQRQTPLAERKIIGGVRSAVAVQRH